MAESSEINGLVFKIRRFSAHDGPGIRTAVFLKGCPMNCIWCHSPEGISPDIMLWHNENICIGCSHCVTSCPSGALELSAGLTNRVIIDHQKCDMTGSCVKVCPTEAIQFNGYIAATTEIMDEILKDRLYYLTSGGGVTLTGGEPLAQHVFSEAILNECRSEGIHTAIETSLYCDIDILTRIASVTDLFIVDLKLFDEEEHINYTGRSNRLILENFKYIALSGQNVLVRIPCIPGITDSEHNMRSITEFARSVNNKINVEILEFNPLARNNYNRLGLPYMITSENQESNNKKYYEK